MAGSSTYPTTVDNKTALQDGVDYMEADNVNHAYVPTNTTQTFIGANGKGASWSSDILDYLANEDAPRCTKASGSTITVSAGTVFIKNAAQANRLMRRNTSSTTVSASNLDTGAMAVGYYYIYAVADTAATTFTVKFSASASSPTGLTNFELIGWFYNETGGVLDIALSYVGNVKLNGREVPNALSVAGTTDITTTSTSAILMTGMVLRFYATGKRPIKITFTATIDDSGAEPWIFIYLDSAEKKKAYFRNDGGTGAGTQICIHVETPSEGGHLIEGYWKSNAAGTSNQQGSTYGERVLTVEEL